MVTASHRAEGDYFHRGDLPDAAERSQAAKLLEHGDTAVRRALAFGTKAGHRLRRPRFDELSIPTPRRTASTLLNAAIDELAVGGFQAFVGHPDESTWRRIEVETEQALALYEEEGWLTDPVGYHPTPPAPDEVRIRPKRVIRTEYESLSFESGWAPHPDEPGYHRWSSSDQNHRVRVLLLRHGDGPRPWLVCVHGAQMGRAPIDVRMFRAEHLHDELGLNVALPVLPHHGPRKTPGEGAATYPGLDMVDNVHGLAQGAWDVRRLLAWIREQDATAVGLQGFSLGGYTVALVAGFEPDLDCVLAGAPAADFPALFRRNTPRRIRDLPRFQTLMDRSEILHRVVSPLLVQPRVPAERRFLFGGVADRLAHPVEQVGRLWHHWGQSEILWVEGGHLGQGLSAEVNDYVDGVFRRTGVSYESGTTRNPEPARSR
jgi:hypothetical protein